MSCCFYRHQLFVRYIHWKEPLKGYVVSTVCIEKVLRVKPVLIFSGTEQLRAGWVNYQTSNYARQVEILWLTKLPDRKKKVKGGNLEEENTVPYEASASNTWKCESQKLAGNQQIVILIFDES